MPTVKIEITKDQADALARGEPVTITPEKPAKKWEPQGGEFLVEATGMVARAPRGIRDWVEFGMRYPTRGAGEKAASLMRPYHRLVAYALEHWPEYEVPDGPQQAWTIAYDTVGRRWYTTFCATAKVPWMPYGPLEKVDELTAKLNSGEVEL